MAGTTDSKDKEKTQTPGQEEPQLTAKIDPEMPPLEDVTGSRRLDPPVKTFSDKK